MILLEKNHKIGHNELEKGQIKIEGMAIPGMVSMMFLFVFSSLISSSSLGTDQVFVIKCHRGERGVGDGGGRRSEQFIIYTFVVIYCALFTDCLPTTIG